jgi:hypothetical protein
MIAGKIIDSGGIIKEDRCITRLGMATIGFLLNLIGRD